MKNFPILILLFTLLFVILLSTGCCNTGSDNPYAVPMATVDNSPLSISINVYSDIVKDNDGTTLIKFRFSYPHMDNPNNVDGLAEINNYYQGQLDYFVNTVIPEIKKAALDSKKAAEEAGLEFFGFVYEREVSIYYNDNQLLSVLNTVYENTGGAHPVSYWSSETFDVKTGRQLPLSEIFGLDKEKALGKVHEIVISQIEENEDKEIYYFDNYEENVKNNFSESDFILAPEGIIFYFQPYAIAPYAAGIPTFTLPYDNAESLAIEISPLKTNELEREVYTNAGRLIEDNKDVFFNIFGLSMLPLELPESIPIEQTVFPVIGSRFAAFSELDNYIRGIYVKSEADSLMNSGRYVDIGGRLHGDISKDTGMGYYIDWSNYRYQVDDIRESSATITIYVVEDSPAGIEEKTIKVNMLKENDRWLLEKMFY